MLKALNIRRHILAKLHFLYTYFFISVPRDSARVVGVVNGDGAGHLVASPVRKQRLKKSKKELAEEAARILEQADQIDCVTGDKGELMARTN